MTPDHPWLYRFGFPGFAEKEWVLPAGVAHAEPWYEPLPPALACADLDRWGLDPTLEASLRALHEAAFGVALVEPAGVPFHQLLQPLRDELARGSLVAWVLRAASVMAPAELPRAKPLPRPEPKTEKTWIEIVLVDDDERPVPDEPYRVVAPDGTVRTGTLDARGFARLDGLDAGTCDVTFPRIDGREWSR